LICAGDDCTLLIDFCLEDDPMPTRLLCAALLILSTFVVVGCGHDDDSDGWQIGDDTNVANDDDAGPSADSSGGVDASPDPPPDIDAGPGPDPSEPDAGEPDAAEPDASAADAGPSCPDESDGYHYVSRDPEECARIFLACDDDQTPFENQCGCGCADDAPTCQAQDIAGEGACRAELGWAFDGQSCAGVYGCECDGDDCDDIFDDQASCQAAYGECLGSATCSPWDARGEGACDLFLGWTYDGQSCRGVSGCDCVGGDCHRITQSRETCRKTVGDCRSQCGDPDGLICDIYASFDPANCPDGSVYTVIGCEPMCVDPSTCEQVTGD
jgi:hypothetical protein